MWFLPILNYIFKTVVIKFVVFTAVVGLVVFLVPFAITQLTPFLNLSSLTALFNSADNGVYYMLLYFRLDAGIPLILSAYIARFLIRRIPFIG